MLDEYEKLPNFTNERTGENVTLSRASIDTDLETVLMKKNLNWTRDVTPFFHRSNATIKKDLFSSHGLFRMSTSRLNFPCVGTVWKMTFILSVGIGISSF